MLDISGVLGAFKALYIWQSEFQEVATDVETSSDIIENMKDGILVNNDDDLMF